MVRSAAADANSTTTTTSRLSAQVAAKIGDNGQASFRTLPGRPICLRSTHTIPGGTRRRRPSASFAVGGFRKSNRLPYRPLGCEGYRGNHPAEILSVQKFHQQRGDGDPRHHPAHAGHQLLHLTEVAEARSSSRKPPPGKSRTMSPAPRRAPSPSCRRSTRYASGVTQSAQFGADHADSIRAGRRCNWKGCAKRQRSRPFSSTVAA